ncbi:MAG: hypothetical protein JKY09_06930 [Crocinitomicaceae bacterium]|nr:hypothetical protein [Crocinitomicaceae bacterium]
MHIHSQTEVNRLKVYIDCQGCDQNFIKQELTYLSYVRDRLLSDVHVMLVNQNTGSGGELFTFFFYGQGDLAGNNDTLTLTTDVNNTRDEIRRKQLKIIQLGLVNYMVKSGYSDQISLDFTSSESMEEEKEKDPWNYWVFSINSSGWFNGQEQSNSMSLNGGFNIDRITEDWKIESGVWLNYNKSEYYFEEDTITSYRQSQWADVSAVKSLTDHFSTGLFTEVNSSLFDNYKLSTSFSPGFEYNIFPYSESTKRQIRVTYKTGVKHNIYNEETIYNRLEETLMYERLGVAAKFQEKWGSVSASVSGSHYFHNFSINRINFWLSLNLRLFKGFSWRISGNLALIHDQISLPLGDASEEEVLLSQRQLQTGYRYWGNTGISYTFGSIYNSVVNPRFGN